MSKGHECRVILHHDRGIHTPYEFEGVDVFGSKIGSRVDAYQWATHVLTHLDFTQYTITMAMQAKRPLIHFVHNDIAYSSINNAPKGQHVVYNSNWIGDKIGYEWPGCVLHPPCDTKFYNVNEKPPIDNEYITLVSCNERKGGYMLYQIAKAMPDKKFLAVRGSYDNPGPMKLTQDQILSMLSELPNVELVPNSPDIVSVYRRTRVLIMPSDYESWGRTATEAMCNGIPVICTPTPGLKENCAEAGTYVGTPIVNAEPGEAQVDIGTVAGWVSAIRMLDDEKIYHEKSLACRARAAELDPIKELENLEQFILQARF